jgi:hypothetical protein
VGEDHGQRPLGILSAGIAGVPFADPLAALVVADVDDDPILGPALDDRAPHRITLTA